MVKTTTLCEPFSSFKISPTTKQNIMKQTRTALSQEVLKTLRDKSEKGIELAKEALLAEKIESERVRDALQFYLLNWSPLAHPGLFAVACEAVGGDPDKMVNVQAAVAMLTAAVDLHDDIIDKSVKKHGRPTVFGKYGHDISLLLGNAFFVDGFTLLGKSVSRLPESEARGIMETIKRLMFEVGTAHALELEFRRRMDVNPGDYMRVIEMKAASVEASMMLGGMAGEGTVAEIDALTKYGRMLGWLATIRDEFIDIYDGEELRQRAKKECLPIPVLLALKDRDSKRIHALLAHRRITNAVAMDILNCVLKSARVKRLKVEMVRRVRKASLLVSEIKREESRSFLTQLAQSTLEDLE
jgi:geranylgeranyl pyrophosphate synthase